jgi:signal transduction histidine kinase
MFDQRCEGDIHLESARRLEIRGGQKVREANEAWRLAERVKELHCLYQISRLLERRDLDPRQTLQEALALVPAAMQYPEAACAQVTLYDDSWETPDFREGPWQLTCPVIAKGEPAGSITVSYLRELPEMDEGPFLRSERSLLRTLAQRFGDYIQQNKAQEQLLAYQNNLRSLAAQLSVTEQRERRRLAEGLHDDIGQSLALISIRLGEARHQATDARVRATLGEIQDMMADVIQKTRSLTFDLCPPILHELGLARAVEWLAKHFQITYCLQVKVEKRGEVEDVCEETRTMLFPAVREVLTNIVKHAGATSVHILLAGEDSRIRISIKDDGMGMSGPRMEACLSGQSGFGLFNIREHMTYLKGTMEMHSEPGQGTEVVLEANRDA